MTMVVDSWVTRMAVVEWQWEGEGLLRWTIVVVDSSGHSPNLLITAAGHVAPVEESLGWRWLLTGKGGRNWGRELG
ncbi:hypothetical protein OIU78_024859 [Salix suchowensis]|nr:hypothetical protein OIU78_024859 [Salix suchowensis]